LTSSDVPPPSSPSSEAESRLLTAALDWTTRHCERARFVVRATDTTFVNEKRFELLAKQEKFAANRLYGTMLRKMTPHRGGGGGDKNHHAVSVEEWPWRLFPPFLRGPSFIISGDVVPRLLTAVRYTPSLPALPQVYFTGLAPLVNKVMRIGVTGFFASDPPNYLNECSYAKYGAIENVDSASLMENIWLSVETTQVLKNKTCTVKPPCLAKVNGRCMYYSSDKKR
jgi:hypothetical protein